MPSSPEIQEIKDRIDVADYLGDYLKLVPAGTGVYKAVCPFHNEKTPSLMISKARQSWHCFGCGAGGDVFEFLMKIENIGFAEALKILADKAGVNLKQQNPSLISHKNRLYDLCELTAKYWHKVLLESKSAETARNYLQKRGLSSEIIEGFRLGYAVDDWSNLFNFLIKRGFRPNEILLAGFCIKKEKGVGYYDRFRDRIMFPIIDHNNRVCGFTGRTLKADEPAKYVNSPQTEIYDKSSIVFALNNAKEEIRKQKSVVVVEGQMDVISAHQFGFRNTVASSGTALTIKQIQILKRFTENIYLALDNDVAGENATIRGGELVDEINSGKLVNVKNSFGRSVEFIDPAIGSNINLKIVSIPYGKDPDECLKNNPDDWLRAIRDALPIMEYLWLNLSKGKDLNDPREKKEIAIFLVEKINKLDNPVERDYWFKELFNRLNIGEASLRELAQKLKSNQKSYVNKVDSGAPESREIVINAELRAFRLILAGIWAKPIILARLTEVLSPEMFFEEIAKTIYKNLILFYTKNSEIFSLSSGENNGLSIFSDFYQMMENLSADSSIFDFLNQSYLLTEKDFLDLSEKEIKSELTNLIKIIKNNYFNLQIGNLKKELEGFDKVGNLEKVNEIIVKIDKLIKQKSSI